jgi:hypothetical protein
MPKYTVYTQSLVPDGRLTNYATLGEFDAFRLVLTQRAVVTASTVEAALKEAKRLRIYAPILAPQGALQ